MARERSGGRRMERRALMPVSGLWRWKFGVLKKRRNVLWKVVCSVPAGFSALVCVSQQDSLCFEWCDDELSP